MSNAFEIVGVGTIQTLFLITSMARITNLKPLLNDLMLTSLVRCVGREDHIPPSFCQVVELVEVVLSSVFGDALHLSGRAHEARDRGADFLAL